MDMQKHEVLMGNDIHTPFAFIFANETERTSAIGFIIEDVNKLAVQEDNGQPTFQRLKSITPITQILIG